MAKSNEFYQHTRDIKLGNVGNAKNGKALDLAPNLYLACNSRWWPPCKGFRYCADFLGSIAQEEFGSSLVIRPVFFDCFYFRDHKIGKSITAPRHALRDISIRVLKTWR